MSSEPSDGFSDLSNRDYWGGKWGIEHYFQLFRYFCVSLHFLL